MSAIVHIGYHKTGTNWFQRHLYPHALSHQYIRRPVVREALLDVGAFAFDPSRAQEILGLESNDAPVLCEEELSGNIHTGGLDGCLSKDIAYRIRAILPHATIVIFVRNQVAMVASAYKQYVREGGTYGLDRYLQPLKYRHNSGFRQAKAPHFTLNHFDYRLLIRHYRQVFGHDQVKVYPFESFVADNEGFARGYAEDLRLEVDWSKVKYAAANEPYRAVTFQLARFLNRFTYRDVADKRHWINVPGLYRKQGKLLRAVNRTPLAGPNIGSEALLGAEWTAAIKERYRASNRQLADELALPLAELGYPV
ncbi:hypothetical protein [Aquisalimonas sp.]|uniref:hypothetical protein n=1 Tax=Aquisalimonas sp. TaxID=1872621 RepID=UPI0025BB9767|nr:hypothetical protein [Aquisalimonas sp.]